MEERLRIEYVPLDLALLWEDNQKRHDIGGIIESIRLHGFKDPPKFEPTLNDGKGGFVEGNGRAEALAVMEKNGDDLPRGVTIMEQGGWAIPVLFGVDAASEAAAAAYGIDHNQLTMAGGDFSIYDTLRMWDVGFANQVKRLAEEDVLPASIDGDAVDALVAMDNLPTRPDFSELVEQLEEAPQQKAEGDTNWFYVEFYGQDERFQELTALLEDVLRTKHEITPDAFEAAIRAHYG